MTPSRYQRKNGNDFHTLTPWPDVLPVVKTFAVCIFDLFTAIHTRAITAHSSTFGVMAIAVVLLTTITMMPW